MIPKIIHYCWFGRKPLPELAQNCLESWKRYFPDYEIKEWNELNFDVNQIPYIKDAYKAKKYAFVSDYARFWILYNYGGLYFDTDVEVIKPMNEILSKGPFMGFETQENEGKMSFAVNPGLGLGTKPNLSFYKEVLDYYNDISFINLNGSYNQTTVVEHVTSLLERHGLQRINELQYCAGVYIYPKDYFCPMDYVTGEMNITENTYSIHHYMASWHTRGEKAYKIFERIFGHTISKRIAVFLKNNGIVK